MATLTEAAYYSRIGIKVGLILLVVMMVGRVVISSLATYWKNTHPAPPPPPTMGFGELPEIKFPPKTMGQYTYKLETPTGRLPNFSDRANVYFMPVERPNLLALENSIDQAESLNYKGEPLQITDSLYRFSNPLPLSSTLEIHIYTGQFKITTDWMSDSSFLLEKKLLTEPEAITEAKSYLKKAKLIGDDLAKGEAVVTYLKSGGGELLKTMSLSEADFLQVDLFRSSLDANTQIVTNSPSEGLVKVIFSGNTKQRIIEVDYRYFPVDYTNFHTYPLKPIQQAWQEMQSGEMFVASLDNDVSEIVVRRVELAYYDSFEPQQYLQPVYVFKGDSNLVAYVKALKPIEQIKRSKSK